jgi:hypothetical protein
MQTFSQAFRGTATYRRETPGDHEQTTTTPYADFGGLTAEQIATMVADHDRDPYPTDRVNQMIKEGEESAGAKS